MHFEETGPVISEVLKKTNQVANLSKAARHEDYSSLN